MVAEGLRQLQEHGVGLGVEHLTLESAYLAVDVPRSSSHSAWAIDDAHSPQETYQRAVLKAWLLDRESSMFADAATEALGVLFADEANPPTASTIVRTAIQAAFVAGYGIDSDDGDGDYLSTDLALRYAIASPPRDQRDAEILGWLQTGEKANRADRIEDSYKPLGVVLGVQPKAQFGEAAYQLFAVAVASLVEGIGLRQRILPELGLDKPVYPVADGEAPPMLIGLCVEALIPTFFEPASKDA